MRKIKHDVGQLPLKITMFGEFSITSGDAHISDTSMRTHQLWHLMEYLIAYRHRSITQGELIEALWPDDNIENPANALKNLVYRVRSALAAHGFPGAKRIVLYEMGRYHWNNDIPCEVDTERFVQLCQAVSNSGLSIQERIDHYKAIVELYKGDFVAASRYESWVVPLSVEYRNMYFKCVHEVLELLQESQQYKTMEEICRKALAIDPFEQSTHKYLMMSLIHQGEQAQAIAHYNALTDLYYRELGVSLSTEMRQMYQAISRKIHDVEIDLDLVKEELREPKDVDGAFYCEYEVFKNMYRIRARTAARSGQAVFIGLLTVTDLAGEALDLKAQTKAMDGLFCIIRDSLRKGDIYARFSTSQYVLMLPTLTYENCERVLGRIVKKYKQTYRPKTTMIHVKLRPLDPVEL
ncbi:BTAD domain-containing putative transcriptional regulator [Oscillospiraceae bacterium MB08-C2-2]|nr:BTAD domain-containing putative transcriptional regulator [Oscillospiraceae bacterium MB08-C2-2]